MLDCSPKYLLFLLPTLLLISTNGQETKKKENGELREARAQPQRTFTPLSSEDLQQYYSLCGYNRTSPHHPGLRYTSVVHPQRSSQLSSEESERLRRRLKRGENGVAAGRGLYPAAISLRIRGKQSCGAVLITWQHAATAAHCFKRRGFADGDTLEVLAGGVCTARGEGCVNGTDMVSLPWA